MRISRFHLAILIVSLGVMLGADTAEAGCKPGMAKAVSAVLNVHNETSFAIHFVYISPCNEERSRVDMLGAEEVILPGTQRAFNLDPGCWDLRGRLSTGREFVLEAIQIETDSSYSVTIGDE